MPYPVPTDRERRALFAWLKQASSLSAWRRLYSHHQVFVDAVAKAYVDEQSTPGMALTLPTDWYASVLRSHDAFYAALEPRSLPPSQSADHRVCRRQPTP
jgi:hypothetical protein